MFDIQVQNPGTTAILVVFATAIIWRLFNPEATANNAAEQKEAPPAAPKPVTSKKAPSAAPELSKESIAIIKATAGVVAENALTITKKFYQNMFQRNPEVLAFFNKSNQRNDEQPKALAHSIIAFASNIENLGPIVPHLAVIFHKHCALSVKPEHYPVVHDNLMLTIGEVLGSAVTPEIGAAWSEGVSFLAGVCIAKEEELYAQNEARKGGWRYEREFKVVKKTKISEDVVTFTFKATDGYNGSFEFDAGQYLTVRLPNAKLAPRHYTITSKSGDNVLEISTRVYSDGQMSSKMHNELAVGDKVLLGAPCGIYTNKTVGAENKKIVLVSAGIGITANKAMLDSFGPSKVVKALHVERSAKKHAFAKHFKDSGVNCEFHYTETKGKFNPVSAAKSLVALAGADAVYLLCAPPTFIGDMKAALNELGANNVQFEKFGTGPVASKK